MSTGLRASDSSSQIINMYRTSPPDASGFAGQYEHRDRPRGHVLELADRRRLFDDGRPQHGTFPTVQLLRHHSDRLRTDLDRDLRVGPQAVVPARMPRRATVGCRDQEPTIRTRQIGQRYDARDARPRPNEVDEDERRAGQRTADLAAPGAELRNDRGVE